MMQSELTQSSYLKHDRFNSSKKHIILSTLPRPNSLDSDDNHDDELDQNISLIHSEKELDHDYQILELPILKIN